jgi:thioredoxin 1
MRVDEYEERIRTAGRPLLVEFWAPWCIPCRMMSPVLTAMKEKFAGEVDLLRVNADESPELIRKLGVLGIPTLIGYRQGEVLFRKTGAQSAAVVESLFAGLSGAVPLTRGPSRIDRIVRAGAGLALVVAGIWAGGNLWMIGLGGLAAFTAVYDRCPIYQALNPRIKTLIKNLVTPQNKTT